MRFIKGGQHFLVTSVYARCSALKRLELWEELETIDSDNIPWLIEGDFNVILNEEEKLGGLDFTQQEAMDFAQCMSVYALAEVNFTSSK